MNKTEYNTLHQWIGRHYVKTGICEHCGQTKRTEWSNKTGNYLLDRRDWQELCKSCHYKYDVEVLGMPTHQERGKLGGAAPHKPFVRGFALNKDRARSAGSKGGKISKRTKQ